MTTGGSGPAGTTSRDSVAGAGWFGEPRDLDALLPEAVKGKPSFYWLRPKVLMGGRRNDVVAKVLGDPSHELRELWLRDRYGDGPRDLTIDRTELDEPTFIVMGDTGEGDISQYAPLPVLAAVGADTDFMVICSDVIYPAGGALEYAYKFCWPYRDYPAPIYALPGNHDWYDGLRGFMAYFCGRSVPPVQPRRSLLSRAGLRTRAWLNEVEQPDPVKSELIATLRQDPAQRSVLPGSYYRIQTGPVDLIAIDTGIDGTIDAAQGAWLAEVSRGPKPKILLTGKPIYVNGVHHPCPIDRGRRGAVDDLVRNPDHHYVAAIGGDVHNYQRYPVSVGERTIQYIVSGGGGAYMHPTHKIPNIDDCDLPGVTEDQFRCYPLRGDSLSFYSQLYDKKFPGDWRISPADAAVYLAKRIGVPPTKPELADHPLTKQVTRRGNRVFPLPGQPHGPWHMVFAEFFDWNTPPLFKNLLRLDASSERLSITCYPATGCVGDTPPTPEDQVSYDLTAGHWLP
jgi:3',5'-cyclic AMP phosphodiesterase CpdA